MLPRDGRSGGVPGIVCDRLRVVGDSRPTGDTPATGDRLASDYQKTRSAEKDLGAAGLCCVLTQSYLPALAVEYSSLTFFQFTTFHQAST